MLALLSLLGFLVVITVGYGLFILAREHGVRTSASIEDALSDPLKLGPFPSVVTDAREIRVDDGTREGGQIVAFVIGARLVGDPENGQATLDPRRDTRASMFAAASKQAARLRKLRRLLKAAALVWGAPRDVADDPERALDMLFRINAHLSKKVNEQQAVLNAAQAAGIVPP